MSGIEPKNFSDYFDTVLSGKDNIANIEADIETNLNILCKPKEKYTEFVKNEDRLQVANYIFMFLSCLIVPAVITLPLYFWSKRKLEVISAANTWQAVDTAFHGHKWSEAITCLNKFHAPIIQERLNQVNTVEDYNNERSSNIPFISSEAAIEASNVKSDETKRTDYITSSTAYLLARAHLSQASEFKKELNEEEVWRNVLKAKCYFSQIRGPKHSKTVNNINQFLIDTKHWKSSA
jgi:hypothetical protein